MIDEKILAKVKSHIFEEQTTVLKTGFKDLDNALSEIEPSGIIAIGGRPGMGKTSFITSLMLNLLKQNKKCLFFSFDTGVLQFIKRLIMQIAEIDASLLSLPEQSADKKINHEKIVDALNKISELDLTIYDKTADINFIRQQIEQVKPEFVFIDHLQLIDFDNKRPRSEIFESIMKELKKIAKDNNCIIFITSLLSRAVENRSDKHPKLSDLRENGAIEDISDVVLLIYRDEYYNIDEESSAWNKGRAEIIIAKNKYGAVCSIELLFMNSIMKFLEPIHCNTF